MKKLTKTKIKALEYIIEEEGKCIGSKHCGKSKCPFNKWCWKTILLTEHIHRKIRAKAAKILLSAKLLDEKVTPEEALVEGGYSLKNWFEACLP